MKLGKRCDFHTHTLLSDGELLLSEHVRRVEELGYKYIGITDHADISNIEYILKNIYKFIHTEGKYYDVRIIPGVELTHVPPELIDDLARIAKEKGAKVVVVHGETIVEPVKKGTNYNSVNSKYVDILAHPGLITEEEVMMAKENNVFLELSARKGHCLTNGHVAKLALKHGVKLLVNSDAHSPEDFITQEFAFKVALAAGLTPEEAYDVVEKNPILLKEKIDKR